MALNGPAYNGLLNLRAAAVEQIQQIHNEIDHPDNAWTATVIDARHGLIDGYWHRFQEIQQRLMLEFSHVEVIMHGYNEAEQHAADVYSTTKAELNDLKVARQPVPVVAARIPKASEIRLSKFSGNYTDWAGWRAEFQVKVY